MNRARKRTAQELRDLAFQKLQEARRLVHKAALELAGNEPVRLLELSVEFMERALRELGAAHIARTTMNRKDICPMKRLPSVDAEMLQNKPLNELLKIRAIADEHFFAEMKKRTERTTLTGQVEEESPKLKAARNVMTLVQNEFARVAELELQQRPSRKTRRG